MDSVKSQKTPVLGASRIPFMFTFLGIDLAIRQVDVNSMTVLHTHPSLFIDTWEVECAENIIFESLM